MKKILKINSWLIAFLLLTGLNVYGQSVNNDPKISFINHNIPKSPESTSFEKYGSIPVGELTGTPDIKIPLYNIEGKNINVPISLNYHPSGIKVNQEATWVGLGWDLVPGGRITLEVKGGYDKSSWVFLNESERNFIKFFQTFISPNTTAINMWGAPPIGSVPPTPFPPNIGFDPALYDEMFKKLEKYGAAEPDLFHVNILGRTFTFYEDLFTQQIKIKGDHNLYQISSIGNNNWSIRDDNGISYYFENQEKSYTTAPPPGMPNVIITSWLLTKIIDINGDEIDFSYQNFGNTFSAPVISESERFDYDYEYNNYHPATSIPVFQEPYYLSKIESKKAIVNFQFGLRDDIGGLGSRKLDKIKIFDKLNNKLVNSVHFNYDYFIGSSIGAYFFDINSVHHVNPAGSSAEDQILKRLRLKSVNLTGYDTTALGQVYKFRYDENTLPDKISLAQDHWGYFNRRLNIGPATTPSLTPSIPSLLQEGILSSSLIGNVRSSFSGDPSPKTLDLLNFNMGNAVRTADSTNMQAGILKAIIYPTGGWTSFEYEPHRSYLNMSAKNLMGGGLRIKRIVNFIGPEKIKDVTDYSYLNEDGTTSGVYQGGLSYVKAVNTHSQVNINLEPDGTGGSMVSAWSPSITLFSNGNLTNEGPNIIYSRVTKRMLDYTDQYKNGYVIKDYKVGAPHDPITQGTYPYIYNFHYLAPTRDNYLEGKLISESYYDHNKKLIKNVKYHYTQKNLLDTLYSLKFVNNSIKTLPPGAAYSNPENVYPMLCAEPARAYFIQMDSVVTKTFDTNIPILTKSTYQYNDYNQVEYSSVTKSDGDTLIQYTKTPLSYPSMQLPSGVSGSTGNAQAIEELKLKYIYNVPIEGITVKKKQNLSETVLNGVYHVYDANANIKETYQLETETPIPMNQFQKSVYGVVAGQYDIQKDARYKLKQQAGYYPAQYLKQITTDGSTSSFVVDALQEHTLAAVKNATHNSIAYTSFESAEAGNWNISGGAVNGSAAHTGKKSYQVSGANIERIGLPADNYIVSYWLRSGSLTANGQPSVAGITVNGWTYHEHKVSVPANGSLLLNGNAVIDELRLYPATASMSSYTYDPLIGISSITDEKSLTTYYEYDKYNYLENIRDQNRNIIKNFKLNYSNTETNSLTPIYFSKAIKRTLRKNNCPEGNIGSEMEYYVPEAKYSSFISQHDADWKAIDEMNVNGQALANSTGTCTPQTMFTLEYSIGHETAFTIELFNTQTNQYFSYSISGSGVLSNIPEGTYNVRINEQNYLGQYLFYLSSYSGSGASVEFSNANLNGTVTLYIMEAP